MMERVTRTEGWTHKKRRQPKEMALWACVYVGGMVILTGWNEQGM